MDIVQRGTEAAVSKAATTATYAGSSGAVIFGLSTSEWSVVGVIGGLIIAFLGFVVNVYFKRQHLLLAKKAMHADADE